METTARLLRLLSLLQTHRFWPGPELADRLSVSARTLRRDVDRLRELGYLVDARRGVEGGYQLMGGSSLPPLVLDDEEAIAIAVSLRTATSGPLAGVEELSVQALAKLEQILPPRLRRRIDALAATIVPFAGRGPTVDATMLATIAQACRDQERIRFAYQRRDGEEMERRAEPFRLVAAGRRWYLVAWDVTREDWRTFRVDRMTEVTTTGWTFEARKLPARDAAEYVRTAIASMPSRYQATITLHVAVDDVPDRVRFFSDGPLEPRGDDRCVLRAKSDSIEWLAADLLLLGVDFDVSEPPELVEHLRVLSARLAAASPPSVAR